MKKKNSLPDLPNYFISKIYLQEYIYYDHSLVISVYSCIASFKKVIFKSKRLATPGVSHSGDPNLQTSWKSVLRKLRIRAFFYYGSGSGNFGRIRILSSFKGRIRIHESCRICSHLFFSSMILKIQMK